MRPDQAIKTVRIARDAQQQHQAILDAVNMPAIQNAMKIHADTISALNLQIQVPKLPPGLTAQLQEQNRRIAEMLDSSGVRNAIAAVEFKLPDGVAEQMAAYREQLEAQVAEDDATEAEGDGEVAAVGGEAGLGRLAKEREAIIICIQRIGFVTQGASFMPGSPIPHVVGFLILALAMIGEVANEKLNERDDD